MKQNLSESIFVQLKKNIIKGDYLPGTRLPSERILAEQYQVSRVTIRDAVRKLAQMGLVEKRPQSGTYVCDYKSDASLDLLIQIMQTKGAVDGDMLLSLMEFRLLTEVFSAQKAARQITAGDASDLERIVAEIEKHITEPDYLSRMDYQLHYKIALLSGNSIIRLMFNVFKPIYRYYTYFFYALPDTGADSLSFHRKLVSAIREGDSSRAGRIMEQALTYAENRVKDALDLSESDREIRLIGK
jgi:GntR family transcriptional repressor for pyruvate dehydrogenase complex